MSALSDVARLAKVSKATASRALSGNGYVSEGTRLRVVSAAESIGYAPMPSDLGARPTRTVGVVIPTLTRWFFAQVLDGIESGLRDIGYDLIVYRVDDALASRQRLFEHVLPRSRVDALIFVSMELTPREREFFRSLGRPVIGVGGEAAGLPCLGIDDRAAAALVTGHLISLGHTRILFFGGAFRDQADPRVQVRRLAGFHQAMDAAGLTSGHDTSRLAETSIQGGYATGLAVLADPRSRPTAIVAGSDEVAVGTIVAARQLGILVPSGLSVIGIDGHDLADMFGLTTLAQEPRDQGRLAVSLALRGVLDPTAHVDPEWRAYPVRLDVRRSTTAPQTR